MDFTLETRIRGIISYRGEGIVPNLKGILRVGIEQSR